MTDITTNQAVTFDALLGAILMHQHTATINLVVSDTEAGLLAQSPAAGTFGFATDTGYLYYYDGSRWMSSVLPLGRVTAGVDMGALRWRDDNGYGEADINKKRLHNITIGDFLITPGSGAFRYNKTSNALQIYTAAQWKSITALSDAENDDIMRWSDYTRYSVDGFGNPIIDDNNRMSLGAFADEVILDGGEL